MTMPSEIDVYGVYVPSFLVLMVASYLVIQVLRWSFARLGLYAFVWHRALFNLGLYVIVLGAAWSLARGIA
jgi:hypothetical protein